MGMPQSMTVQRRNKVICRSTSLARTHADTLPLVPNINEKQEWDKNNFYLQFFTLIY